MQSKIKIGINASFLRKPNTGIGQVTTNFLSELDTLKTQDFEFILYLEEAPKNIRLSKKFTTRIFLPLWRRDDLIRKIWWEKFSLPRQVKKDGCDVFFSLYQCPTVTHGSAKRIKHIMLAHDIIPKLFPIYLDNSRKRKYWRLTEKGLSHADKIIAVSKRTEKDLIEHLHIEPGKITTSYIDVSENYRKKVLSKESVRVLKKYKLKPGYILAGGGYEVRKNVAGVMHAYKFLRDKFQWESPLPPLVIYGKLMPELAPLIVDAQKLAQELNLTKSVKFLGETSAKDLPALFKNSIFFIYPSHYEGFGLPILEAMNLGKPVITSKVSSLPEVGGDSVLYCDPDDTHDIAMVMKNVLGNRDLREQLSIRAGNRAKQFSWENFVRKILRIAQN